MTRPIPHRAARERCPHGEVTSVNPALADAGPFDSRPWCTACGVFWTEATQEEIDAWVRDNGLDSDEPVEAEIDWPATERADREQAERDGQWRLPL